MRRHVGRTYSAERVDVEAEDAHLLEAARDCTECVSWLDHCDAACCRMFAFRLKSDSWVDRMAGEVRIHVRLDDDLRRYYELHGARTEGDSLVVPEHCCEFTSDQLRVTMTCAALRPDRLCSLHPAGKPEACRDYTLEAVTRGDYQVHPSCLFRYQLMLRELEAEVGPGDPPRSTSSGRRK